MLVLIIAIKNFYYYYSAPIEIFKYLKILEDGRYNQILR